MNIRKLKLTKKRIWLSILGIVLVAGLYGFWSVWLSRTYIAFVNYQPISLQAISQANDNPMVKLFSVDADDIDELSRYDVIFINGMGLNITAEQRAVIQGLADGGKPIYTTMATNPDNNISNLTTDETAIVQSYTMFGGKQNYRSLLSFVRHNIDGKIIYTGNIQKPQETPSDYIYYPAEKEGDDEQEFFTVADYEKFLKEKGLYINGGKRIVVTGQLTDPSDLIRALVKEKKYNVYPVASFTKLQGYVEQIAPDAIINLAHGRLGDDMVEYLKAHNTLLFDPLTINELAEDWEADPQGMLGGFLSQSVVMPEIDGSIRTSVLFAQRKDKNGLLQAYAIPERLKDFVACVGHHLDLRTKDNKDKRVAIVYFKGPGQAGLVASGLDVVPSLYNTLNYMKAQGYNLSGLPSTVEEFARQIKERGSLFNAFAAGDAARFLTKGQPQWVTKADYDGWTSQALRKDRREAVDKVFGAFPGDHNLLQKEGRLAFPCIQYGNVVLLPQPIAGEGKDVFKIVHGTDQVPPHSYIAPYLWIQYAFKADALVHFGTHGSLEFTPKKQIALSNNDWSDRLVGALPHFYYYTIDNVGEAMTAKRRSYATILSYLTAPFHESNLRSTYAELEKALRQYGTAKDKQAAALQIKQLTVALGIHKDLNLDGDTKKPYTDADIEHIESYADELASEKVSGTPYTTGIAYTANDIRTSVEAISTDPIAYSRYNIDRLLGRAKVDPMKDKYKFNDLYLNPARALVSKLYAGGEVSDAMVCSVAGLTPDQLAKAHATTARLHAPKGMLAMMQAAAKKEKEAAKDSTHKAGKPSSKKDKEKGGMDAMMGSMKGVQEIPEAKNGPIAKFMRKQMRKMLAKKDPSMMLEVAKKMGASDEQVKKMGEAMKKKMGTGKPAKGGMMGQQGSAVSREDRELADAVEQIEQALRNVSAYRQMLQQSPQAELQSFTRALSGGYIAPSPGGDPIANPNTLPTGRNLFAINAEETPTEDAWEKGVALAQSTIADYQKRHKGEYPRKVSFTLWSGEFIQTGGATIAQALYMLGVEPVRDRYGRVSDIRLIPAHQLGRPRIDVVVQTSGQLRDLAASRLFLINRAVTMAAEANDGKFENNVKAGVEESERYLIDKGISPKQAREMASYRVFGGLQGGYGSGIQSMVESGGSWDDEQQVADTYLNNMSGFYGSADHWEEGEKEAFAAALTRTDMVVQPRQNNSWGALSLDHVYEFMGGMDMAVRNVTGKDPDAVFSDYRNRNNYRVQDSKEAIAVEARTKLFNKDYIKESMQGGANSVDGLAEMARNAYGWNVMKPKAVDKEMWNEMYDVYVKDKYNLGIHEQMGKVNPAAMQEMTATMMETARKGYWKATPEQLKEIARVHTSFVQKYGPSGSSFEGGNKKLQQFISQNTDAPTQKAYAQSMRQMTTASAPSKDAKGMVMEKQSSQMADQAEAMTDGSSFTGLIVVAVVVVVFVALTIVIRKKRKA